MDNSIITSRTHHLACTDCDLLMPKIRPSRGQKALCPRCGKTLLQSCPDPVNRSLAAALVGLFLFFPAVCLPLLTFRQLGLAEQGNILQTISGFWDNGYYLVAAAAFLATILFPLLKLSLLALVTLCLRIGRIPGFVAGAFRLHNAIGEWAMLEVYLLGIMITIIKMHNLLEISYNIGFFCFIGLVLATLSTSLTVSRETFWDIIEKKQRQDDEPVAEVVIIANGGNAAGNDIVVCRSCGKLTATHHAATRRCRRCGAALHLRKPGSLPRTWALILTASALLLPANLLPIMRVQHFGRPNDSTIIDGIQAFFQSGSYLIAAIILTASILIPIFKIVGLTIGLLTITCKRRRYLRQKSTMFRFIEFIGRWSMLDIFVIALLGHYVDFGFLSSIDTAPAATYFSMVVITTMLAALTFDPRLMWDLESAQNQQDPCSA